MAIRVALIGTGNCGSLALQQLIERRALRPDRRLGVHRTPRWARTRANWPGST